MTGAADPDGPLLPAGCVARRRTVRGTPGANGRWVDLAVAELGDPARPAVVVAHGVGSSARFVAAAVAPPLLAAGWRVVTYDARGHGASSACPEPTDHSLDAYADDLAAVVGTTGRAGVVGGISLGGHAALRWRGDLPRVVCLPAWLGTATPGDGPHAYVAAEVRTVGIDGVLARLRADTTMVGWLRETLVTDYARHEPRSLAAALLALDGGDAPTAAEVAALGAPAGVVAWRDDPGHPFAVAEQVAATADAPLVELAIGDLDGALTRFGDAWVRILGALGLSP